MGWSYPPDGLEFQVRGDLKDRLGAYSHWQDILNKAG
jgi:hypothetical protein